MDIDNDNNVNSFRALIINFAIEMIVYAILVVGYFYAVLRLLATFLADLFNKNAPIYAVVGLGLIVAQGLVLEIVTSFILDWLNLERLE